MVLPKDVKPEDVMHPTGVFYRNPTHKEEADNAMDQSQIVRAIIGAGRERLNMVLTYTEDSKPWILPGFAEVRTLDHPSLVELCKSLMRFRPNVFKIHIKLGDYKGSKPINTNRTRHW